MCYQPKMSDVKCSQIMDNYLWEKLNPKIFDQNVGHSWLDSRFNMMNPHNQISSVQVSF